MPELYELSNNTECITLELLKKFIDALSTTLSGSTPIKMSTEFGKIDVQQILADEESIEFYDVEHTK